MLVVLVSWLAGVVASWLGCFVLVVMLAGWLSCFVLIVMLAIWCSRFVLVMLLLATGRSIGACAGRSRSAVLVSSFSAVR